MVLMDIEAGFWDIRRQMEALIGSRMTSSVLQQAGMNGGASFARSFLSGDSENLSAVFQACLQAYQLAGFGQFEIKNMQWPLGKIVVEASETFESWMIAQHEEHVDAPICAYTAGVLAGFFNVISNRHDIVCVEQHCQALGAENCTFELLPAAEAGDQTVIPFVSDPMLGRQLDLLEILFDRMPMGIAIYDRDYRLVRFNLTWVSFNQKYTMAKPDQIVPGAHIFDIQPGTEDVVIPRFERVFQGETIQQDCVRIVSRGIESFWDVVLTPLYDGDQVVGLMNVSTDVTERMIVLRDLEKRVQERTDEIEHRRQAVEGLWETLRVINSNASLDETLDFIVGQADAINESNFVSISMMKGPDGPIQIHAFRGDFPEEMRTVQVDIGEGTVGRAIKEKRIIAISNVSEVVQAPSPDAIDDEHQIFISQKKQDILDIAAQHFQAVLAIPLMTSRQIYGALIYYYPEPRAFAEQEIQLASSFAEQAALAIENARLHQAEADRQRELKLLLDLAAAANNPLNLDEMLESTMDRLVELVGASRVGLMLTDKETGELGTYLIRPEQGVSVPQVEMDKMLQACRAVAASGKPLFLSPNPAQGLFEPGALLPLGFHSQSLGVLGIIGAKGARFSDAQLSLFKTIADQFGTAVENAYLSAEVRENAVQRERNRLARDLHDAVTQTLFSASLVAEVLPKLWKTNPELGKQKLDDLRKLTRGALSEMRTMLMELRPSALEDADIEDLFQHLINAFTARSMVTVLFNKEGDEDPPVPVKEVFYRVGQEALNNIEKHAGAQKVEISLSRQPGDFSMLIRDDGCGFNPAAVSQDHLGLGIMAERAKNLGAVLHVDSTASVGTEISLRWNANKEAKE